MKIKRKFVDFYYTEKLNKPKHRKPLRPLWILGAVIRLISLPDLWATKFKFTRVNMEKAGRGPYLILMNHSSFIDLEIAYRIFFPKPFCTVCTSDGFVGKSLLMRMLGCIPTNKFVTDISLISDMLYAVKQKKSSVLMYPEASYTFDGCATPLPARLGILVKKLGIPLVMVKTDGAFLRDPLYNGLQKRKTRVSATVKCLFSAEEIATADSKTITAAIEEEFAFDNFAEQFKNKIEINAPFRADGLERILYKCADCDCETEMVGKGTNLSCRACGKEYEMTVLGRLSALDGKTKFPHIPDWYSWERECVKQEIERGEYLLDCEVEIGIMADFKAIYMIGSGRLTHSADGFTLKSDDGRLCYTQSPTASYGLYADYYWYEIADVICIGDKNRLYYCFPKQKTNVAKARLAAEEIYKLNKK